MVLRWVARNWLGNLARRKVRETVVGAARAKVAEAAESAERESPGAEERPCDVGVVFALGIEAGGLEDLLEGPVYTRGHGFVVRQGGLRGRQVAVVQSGAGAAAASHAAEALLSGHEPRWVISAGFAGGLTERLKHHDLVLADGLVGADGSRLAIDLRVDPASLERTPGVHVGRLLTVDRIVGRPHEKRALGEKHGALAVDMESRAVAEVCRRHRVRFLAVRIVSDAVDEELPPDVRGLLKQTTRTARAGAAVGAIFRRPSSVKDMWKLREDALVASDRLARFLAATIEQLTAGPPEGGESLPAETGQNT
jgi:adenosylhomocysteine nucleosidase